MDRIRAELSEGPVTPAYDPDIGPSEHVLYFDSFSRIVGSPWKTSAGVR